MGVRRRARRRAKKQKAKGEIDFRHFAQGLPRLSKSVAAYVEGLKEMRAEMEGQDAEGMDGLIASSTELVRCMDVATLQATVERAVIRVLRGY